MEFLIPAWMPKISWGIFHLDHSIYLNFYLPKREKNTRKTPLKQEFCVERGRRGIFIFPFPCDPFGGWREVGKGWKKNGKKQKKKKKIFYANLIKMTSSHSRIRAIKTTQGDIFSWILTVNDAILRSTSTSPALASLNQNQMAPRDPNTKKWHHSSQENEKKKGIFTPSSVSVAQPQLFCPDPKLLDFISLLLIAQSWQVRG